MHLPFIQGTTYKIAKSLKNHKVPSKFRPLNTIWSSLISVKDHVNPKDGEGVYVIPCSCWTLYIGETRRSINWGFLSMQLKSNMECPTPLLCHNMGKGKNITYALKRQGSLQGLVIFITVSLGRLEIERRPINLNRDNGWSISRCWIPCIRRFLQYLFILIELSIFFYFSFIYFSFFLPYYFIFWI